MDSKKGWRRFFDSQREGPGVEKSEAEIGTGLRGFFFRYKTYFTRLLSVNLLMVFGNFPILFALIALSTWTRVLYPTPVYASFPFLHGLLLQGGELSLSTLLSAGIEGTMVEASAMTPLTHLLFGLSALTVFTFGIVNVGTTYVLRNMVKGDPVFIWSDFFYAVKRNWRQALPFGILDALFLALIPFNLVYFYNATTDFWSGLMFGAMLLISLLYFWMRFYIYIQMVTFDLSVYKILKNSLIFALLGIKRNLMATLGIFLLVMLDLFLVVGLGGVFSAVALLLPLVLLFSNGAFMSAYAAFYKVKEVMIDPYEGEAEDGEDAEDGEETVDGEAEAAEA